MAKFSKISLARLEGAHPLLQKVMHAAIEKYDFTVLQSQRGRADQEEAFRRGNTRAHFGQSAHNWDPAIALDVAPYPIDWSPSANWRFIDLNKVIGCFNPATGFGYGLAKEMKIPLRWGGDWHFSGKTGGLVDLPHYELHPWRAWAKKSKLFGA
jgi:peptidoglycan L-alanyl-D-glutamate endopeptidase CwlK